MGFVYVDEGCYIYSCSLFCIEVKQHKKLLNVYVCVWERKSLRKPTVVFIFPVSVFAFQKIKAKFKFLDFYSSKKLCSHIHSSLDSFIQENAFSFLFLLVFFHAAAKHFWLRWSWGAFPQLCKNLYKCYIQNTLNHPPQCDTISLIHSASQNWTHYHLPKPVRFFMPLIYWDQMRL